MAKKSLISALITLFVFMQSPSVGSRPVTTPEIITTTTAAISCLQYNPVAGICFWLVCSGFSCKIKTSTKVKHWNPDVVVSSYTTTGESTWLETRGYSASFIAALGSGDDTGGRVKNGQHTSTVFREVDAIGNPALLMMSALSGTGYMCPSVATAYFPYFLSAVDSINWRFATLEMLYPASTIPGFREIGTWPLNTWGAVYPRTGFVTQNEGPKANAVTAQRAGDIITRTLQPHLYWPLGNDCSSGNMKCWAPGPLKENDAKTGQWQSLAPFPGLTCSVFGENDVFSPLSWATFKQDYSGDFAWNLWREYGCCKRKGIFLFAIDFQ